MAVFHLDHHENDIRPVSIDTAWNFACGTVSDDAWSVDHITACAGSHQRLQVTHPKHYDLCMRPVQDGGLGMKRVLEYMEIPFETWESVGQMRMEFDKEGEMKTA